MTTGAQALLRTLVDAGTRVCFTNPGTSEMHFVAALDDVPEMRAILALFEGVATGAADGYARMAGRPAATLLHLGPGLGNGLANLHNARRARVPVVNIVGDHATYHVPFDAQLQSDIETVARNVSPGFVRTATDPQSLSRDVIDAITAASRLPGSVATLIVPANVSWSEGAELATMPVIAAPRAAPENVLHVAVEALRHGKKTALLLGGAALHGRGLQLAGQLAAATGVTLLAEVFPTRIERGAGLPKVERLAYLAEMSQTQLRGLEHLVLVDAAPPVSFFAYPGIPSNLVPDGCAIYRLTVDSDGVFYDVAETLAALVDSLKVGHWPIDAQAAHRPSLPNGPLTAASVCQTVAALLPERAIVVDESLTSGSTFPTDSAGCPPHDVLTLTGGAIGMGLPLAVGAAVACPDRPVISLEADGSAMYTIQALWTMARENLDVTVIILNNRSYGILNVELQRTGAKSSGAAAHSQLDLSAPAINFVSIAEGMGVPATRPTTAREFAVQLSNALAEPGPHLIEVVIPPAFTGRKLRALPVLLKTMKGLPAPLANALRRRIAP
ncbi:MAG: acetolactate synthase large subunit [Nakamurella sp.]